VEGGELTDKGWSRPNWGIRMSQYGLRHLQMCIQNLMCVQNL